MCGTCGFFQIFFSLKLGFNLGYQPSNQESVIGVGHPGEGNGNLLQYSCLENLMDRGAWQATAYGVAKGEDS